MKIRSALLLLLCLAALTLLSCGGSGEADAPQSDSSAASDTPAQTEAETEPPFEPTKWAEENMLMKNLSGEESITRLDFISMLAAFSENVMGYNLAGYVHTAPIWSDVAADSENARAAVWAGAWRLVEGEDGILGANEPLSGGELNSMLYKYINVWLEDRAITEQTVSALTGISDGDTLTAAKLAEILRGIELYAAETSTCDNLHSHMKRGVNVWTWDNSLGGNRVAGEGTTLYKEIWDAGFDHVRLVWDATDVETRDRELFTYTFNTAEQKYTVEIKEQRIDNVLSAATQAVEAGHIAVVDLHGINFTENPTDSHDPDENGRLFVDLWAYIAEQLRELPPQVFFELANETGIEGELVEQTIDAIRATGGNNAERMIIVYSYHWTLGEDIIDIGKYNSDPHVMWDIHNYGAYNFAMNEPSGKFDENGLPIPKWHYGAEGTGTRQTNIKQYTDRMATGKELTELTGQKVWYGEYGVYGSAGAEREEYLTDYFDYMLDYGHCSACYWSLGYYDNNNAPKPFGNKWYLEFASFGTVNEAGEPEIFWEEDVMRSIFS